MREELAISECPVCRAWPSPVLITRGGISVCDCGATHTQNRHATHADLEMLSDDDVATLRQQRARRHPHVKASQR